jgi:hypothetical protein
MPQKFKPRPKTFNEVADSLQAINSYIKDLNRLLKKLIKACGDEGGESNPPPWPR